MRGCDSTASVMRRAKATRSTASARPAGTAHSSAASMTSEPSRRISSLSSPAAFESPAARSEFEQTSSAKSRERWAGEKRSGFISKSSTSTPRRAICHAASQPARPAPITLTLGALRPPMTPPTERPIIAQPRSLTSGKAAAEPAEQARGAAAQRAGGERSSLGDDAQPAVAVFRDRSGELELHHVRREPLRGGAEALREL